MRGRRSMGDGRCGGETAEGIGTGEWALEALGGGPGGADPDLEGSGLKKMVSKVSQETGGAHEHGGRTWQHSAGMPCAGAGAKQLLPLREGEC